MVNLMVASISWFNTSHCLTSTSACPLFFLSRRQDTFHIVLGHLTPQVSDIQVNRSKPHFSYHGFLYLFPDDEPMEVPDEMMLCIKDGPEALKFFKSLTDSEQKYYADWIYSAKREETKIERMAETVNRLLKGLKQHD